MSINKRVDWILPLRYVPAKVLRIVCRPCPRDEFGSAWLLGAVADIIETMHKHNGIGLAAPQVGRDLRLCVVPHVKGGYVGLVNPKIIRSSGLCTMREGCLSIPGVTADIERPERVTIRAFSPTGELMEFSADGIVARVCQHEIDHLNGKLFTDRVKRSKLAAIEATA